MTLTSTTVKVQYNGNGSRTLFPVPFDFWDPDDFAIIHTVIATGAKTPWVRGTQYTVTGGSGAVGDVVVNTTPIDHTPATGERLTILADLADLQPLSLPLGGELPSLLVEQAFDKTVRLVQQRQEKLSRTLLLSDDSQSADLSLPDPVAGKVLRWNTAEDGLENTNATDGGPVTLPVPITDGGTGAQDAATARTNLGLVAFNAAVTVALWRLGPF